MFPNLKLQIFRCGSHQYQLARAVGIDETVLSKIIHGYREPTVAQRKLLSGFLDVDESWLFERFEVQPQQSAQVGARLATDKEAGEDGAL
jgi:transcriptional regulator with XRE-family HTH domain